MCLILIARQYHRDYPLVIAANRDEYFDRPARPAGFWPEHPQLLAGQDLSAGGTWLGITRSGRFAALTNVREPDRLPPENAISRGHLVTGFLTGEQSPEEYLQQLPGEGYSGFNLICGNHRQIWYASNRQPGITAVTEGAHGLSNATLNTPWPKVVSGTRALTRALDGAPELAPDQLLPLLNHRQRPADEDLPDTGVGLPMEQILSSRFIEGQSVNYGTRASTVLLIRYDGLVKFKEWQWDEQGQAAGAAAWEFMLPG